MANVIADYMASKFEEVQPMNFYREIFGDGVLDERGNFTPGKYVGVAVELGYAEDGKKVDSRKKHIITDDLDNIDELAWESNKFCLMAPISYAGWSRKTDNARTMFALGVEIDNLVVKKKKDGTVQFTGLEALIHQWNTVNKYTKTTILPKPTFLAASGNGVHLYYQFEEPLRLTEWVKKSLMLYKEKLTRVLWNQYVTTDHAEDKIQFESAFQAFRMVGSATRLGMKTGSREDRCRAFRVGDKISVDYLNSFLDEDDIKKGLRISPTYEGKTRLEDAKEKWPEWYQTNIVEGKKYSKKWDIAGKVHGDDPYALYHWWLNKIRSGAVVGKRYHCMYCLAVYAIKNDVPEEKLVEDCYDLQGLFDGLTPDGADESTHFTAADVEAALQVFDDRGYFNYPIRKIVKRSGIHIEPNKRNKQKMEWHLEDMRAKKAKMKQRDQPFKRPEGRPEGSKNKTNEKGAMVRAYRGEHPEANVTEVARALGISRPTVYKWWDASAEDVAPKAKSKPKKQTPVARPIKQGVVVKKQEEPEDFDWRAMMAEATGMTLDEVADVLQKLQKENKDMQSKENSDEKND